MGIEAQVVERGGLWGARRFEFESLPSTNAWCAAHGSDYRHGDVVQALVQTAGHGRFDRPWVAPAGLNLTVSFVLRSPALLALAPNTTQAAALAVRDLLAAEDIPARLKWPNDVLAADLKMAGILAEASGDTVVVGVGLNVNMTAADIEAAGLAGTAGSMRTATGCSFELDAVLADLTRRLETELDLLVGSGPASLRARWRPHDWLKGATVEVDTGGTVLSGRARGLDECGRLLVADPEGRLHAVDAGDVRRVRPARQG